MPGQTAHIQELRTGIGVNAQVDLATALGSSSMICLRQTSRNIAVPKPQYEDDTQEIGKGDVWATQRFPTGLDLDWPWEAYLSSQNAALLGAFGLGHVTSETPGSGDDVVYVFRELNMVTDGIDGLPATTICQQMRTPGSTDVIDVAHIGCCLEEFGISLKSGLGRQNATIRSRWVGTGKYATPSGIVLPALASEASLNATGASAITILGENFVTNKRFLSFDAGYKNNIRLDNGYRPGSGVQAAAPGQPEFSIRNAMRRGDPSGSLSFSAEFIRGSVELQKLLDGTEGAANLVLPGAIITGSVRHKLEMLYHRVGFSATEIGETDGIVTARVDCTVMKHASNGVLTMTVTTNREGIGAEAA